VFQYFATHSLKLAHFACLYRDGHDLITRYKPFVINE
jgi:hypothetical protein